MTGKKWDGACIAAALQQSTCGELEHSSLQVGATSKKWDGTALQQRVHNELEHTLVLLV